MVKLPEKLERKLAERQEIGALRCLPESVGLIDFSSNDYLGISSGNFEIKGYLKESLNFHPYHGSTGSRLISGNRKIYKTSEKYLASTFGTEEALIFNSGYDANVGFFSSVPQRDDIVLYDSYIHASIRDGLSMGNAKNHSFHHNDLKDLENRIARLRKKATASSASEIYVVTEAVFSMDGDIPNLIKISEICSNYNCKLIVDEAHSIGVCGLNGLGRVVQLGLVDRVFALIVTFGKALGSHGAAILGAAALKSFLVNFSRSFIYTTALPSHTIANTIAGFEYIKSEVGEEERKSLLSNISFFKDLTTKLELDQSFIPSNSAIHSCIIKGNFKVKSVSRKLQAKGYDVRAILYPTVPKELERLRFCLHSFNSKTEIEGVLLQLSKIIK